MTGTETEILNDSAGSIVRAAVLLRQGRLVAFPTETVYGLGADACDDLAVARIFEAKKRPRFNPLIVHVPDAGAAAEIGRMDERAKRLVAVFWPGPLTVVVKLRAEAAIAPLVTAGGDSVALRVPAHPLAQRLLSAFGGPLAAPSANPSGRISPTRADHVLEGLGGRIAAVVDGGECAVGLESTILDLRGGPVRLLRPGGVPSEAVEACLGAPLADAGAGNDRPVAPGRLASHYAPSARLRLDAEEWRAGEVLVGFGPGPADYNLSPAGDLVEAAAALFRLLHDADAAAGPQGVIAVAPIPDEGLGRAINDRLRRAAAPRN